MRTIGALRRVSITATPCEIQFAALPAHTRYAAGFRHGVNGLESGHAHDYDYSRGYLMGRLTKEEEAENAIPTP